MRRDPVRFLKAFFTVFSVVGLFFTAAGVALAVLIKAGWMLAISFWMSGGIFLLVGLIGLCVIGRRTRFRRWLIENGRPINAELDGCIREYGVRYTGRVPYVIECHYADAETRTIYQFRSAFLWTGPAPFLAGRGTVRVLVDPRDYRRYYVDTDALTGGYKVVG